MCGILAKSLAVVVGDDEIVLGRVIVHVAVAEVGVFRIGAAAAVPASDHEGRGRIGVARPEGSESAVGRDHGGGCPDGRAQGDIVVAQAVVYDSGEPLCGIIPGVDVAAGCVGRVVVVRGRGDRDGKLFSAAAVEVAAGQGDHRRHHELHSVGGVIFAVADLGKFMFCDIVGRLAAVHPLLGVAPGAVGLQVPHVDAGQALAVLVLVAARVAEDLIHTVAIHVCGGHFEVGVVLLQVAGPEICQLIRVIARLDLAFVDRGGKARDLRAVPLGVKREYLYRKSAAQLPVADHGVVLASIGAQLDDVVLVAAAKVCRDAGGILAAESVVGRPLDDVILVVAERRVVANAFFDHIHGCPRIATRTVELVDRPEQIGSAHPSIVVRDRGVANQTFRARIGIVELIELSPERIYVVSGAVGGHVDLVVAQQGGAHALVVAIGSIDAGITSVVRDGEAKG